MHESNPTEFKTDIEPVTKNSNPNPTAKDVRNVNGNIMLETQPREYHIWDFPEEFYVQLAPDIVEALMTRASETVGGIRLLARKLNVARNTVIGYQTSQYSLSLPFFKQLCALAGERYTMAQMEAHIIAYKGSAKAHFIQNPHLPLIESPELFALMGHLAGDGGHELDEAHVTYTNAQETLTTGFLELLRNVFGEVPFRIRNRIRQHQKQTFEVIIGITVVRLLQHLYGIDFRTHTARMPPRLFALPREFASAYIRAYGDDEGSVRDAEITLYSSNKKLLQDISTLVREKFPELADFSFEKLKRKNKPKKWTTCYLIRFRANATSKYASLIGFTHPEKHHELQRNWVRINRGWKQRDHGETRRLLLKLLKTDNMNIKTLAERLNIRVKAVRRHLNALIEWKFVLVKKIQGSEEFEILEHGRKFLQLPEIGLLSGRYGQTKVAILRALQGKWLSMKALQDQLGLTRVPVLNHLNGLRDHTGKRRSGLLRMGLVKQLGNGGPSDPYVYGVTDKGKWFLNEVAELFPNLGAGK